MGAGVCEAFHPDGPASVPGGGAPGSGLVGRTWAWQADGLDFKFQLCHLLAEALGQGTRAHGPRGEGQQEDPRGPGEGFHVGLQVTVSAHSGAQPTSAS